MILRQKKTLYSVSSETTLPRALRLTDSLPGPATFVWASDRKLAHTGGRRDSLAGLRRSRNAPFHRGPLGELDRALSDAAMAAGVLDKPARLHRERS